MINTKRMQMKNNKKITLRCQRCGSALQETTEDNMYDYHSFDLCVSCEQSELEEISLQLKGTDRTAAVRYD